MVTTSARVNEEINPTTSRKLSQHLLRLITQEVMSPNPKEVVREVQTPVRFRWRQAISWTSTPVILHKNIRHVASQKSHRVSACNQNEAGIENRATGSAECEQQYYDEPQDNVKTGPRSDRSSILSKANTTGSDNLYDLSSSNNKPALSGLRQAKSSAIYPTSSASPLKVLQSSVRDLSLSQLKRAALFQELCEFSASDDAHITFFPEYFSDEELRIVQNVAQNLQLGCQVVEKTVAVYKPIVGHLQKCVSQYTSPANDVFVNVHQLARQGKASFFAKLCLQRMSPRSGIQLKMLWDVAELITTPDLVVDPISEGEGGVYAVQSRSSGQKLALFKPADEEKFEREGLMAGEGAVREEVAYLLDSLSNGFSGVPPTAVAQLRLPNAERARRGAVQRFMSSSIGSMESFGMPFHLEKACKFVPVEQVHRIALLDLRVFNTDRHPGNILLIGEMKPYSMVPIDHGCILPSWFHLSEARFDWLEYPQSREPLSFEALQYIEALDAEQDSKILRNLSIREECVTTLKICTLFLKLAAAQGKSLFWMGKFIARDGCFQHPSGMEVAIQKACKCVGIPYTFKSNQFDEQRGEIERGVLSRRPSREFFLALEHLLRKAISNVER
ncbi:hypothetical protein CCR75_000090 [Bremia lactucae]|uniref:PI3K/PI4K catalytic domain-containing protein n=1 Tax=Bremia lactucae TaxID=4779 RepID=A0A976ID74_BRELC|nr:hypothetical protein CCR75_000090 [Bremia lactucae]